MGDCLELIPTFKKQVSEGSYIITLERLRREREEVLLNIENWLKYTGDYGYSNARLLGPSFLYWLSLNSSKAAKKNTK